MSLLYVLAFRLGIRSRYLPLSLVYIYTFVISNMYLKDKNIEREDNIIIIIKIPFSLSLIISLSLVLKSPNYVYYVGL